MQYTCPRQICHCEAANNEELGPDDSISSRSLSSERRHAEYFYRPPILSIHREQLMLNGSPYSFFAYNHDPNAEAEYCEQCQFCSASSKWCGRVPSNQIVKLPRSFLDDTPSDTGLYGASYLNNMNLSNLNNMRVQVPNATWVQDPLIVNAAHISFMDENFTPRDQQFQPAVFVRLPFVSVATCTELSFCLHHLHPSSHHFTDSHHHLVAHPHRRAFNGQHGP